jgi:hypothetical protein
LVRSLGPFISINLVNSYEKQSFLARNKDQLIVGIIGAIIGTIFGTIIGGIAVWYILRSMFPAQ